MKPMTLCLWFDGVAEEAARFYLSVFKDGSLGRVARFPDAGFDHHGQPAGKVMTVEFEINGMSFLALNGGPIFKPSEATSLIINCKDQSEVDYYWEKLTANGGEAVQCGWLKDRYGYSWQVVPVALTELMNDPDTRKTKRVMEVMLEMKKLDIKKLEAAYRG